MLSVDIVNWLKENRNSTTKEIARAFGKSEKEIRKELEHLEWLNRVVYVEDIGWRAK